MALDISDYWVFDIKNSIDGLKINLNDKDNAKCMHFLRALIKISIWKF